MVAIDQYGLIVEKTLCELAKSYASAGAIRTVTAYDRENGQYLLIDEGWEGYRRIYAVWAHVELTNGKISIHEDGTEEGIANLLVAAGVPKRDIALSFHAPNLRGASEFAAA